MPYDNDKVVLWVIATGLMIFLFNAVFLNREGKASWYSRNSPGVKRTTANNERFDDQAMTCAMWGVPFNRMVRVTNKANGKSVVVRVNDRGPHKRYVRTGRIIDLTKAAFTKLAPLKKGMIDVRVKILLF